MRVKKFLQHLFPFSAGEYLKVFGCFAIFLLMFYFSAYVFSYFVGSVPFAAEKEVMSRYFMSLLLLVLGLAVLSFLALTFLIFFAYSAIARKKLSLKVWPKFMLSFVVLALIFTIPYLFSLRLIEDGFAPGIPLFIALFFIFLHFSNISFLFTALEGRSFAGVRKGFWFGTAKIKHLILPYIIILAVSAALSLAIRLAEEMIFINILLSCAFLSWAALYSCRTVMKHAKGVNLLNRSPRVHLTAKMNR